MSSIIVLPYPFENLEQYARAHLVAWVEFEEFCDGRTALFEIAEPHLQIGVTLQGEEVETRQHVLIVGKRSVAGRNLLPIRSKPVLARCFFQTQLCNC